VGPQGESQSISSVSFDGSTLSLTVSAPQGTLSLTVTVEGDTFEGTASLGGQSFPVSGERTSAPETLDR
jgi:hypothetical protein